jgi:hypothetical protein
MIEFCPGIYRSMAAERYHAVEAFSSGGARALLRSPQHYKLERETPNEPTDRMIFGTVVHTGVLEPLQLEARVAAVPTGAPKRPTAAQINAKKPSLETLEAIAFWTAFDAANADKIVLSLEDYKRALRCIDAVQSHSGARTLIEGAETEVSLFWLDARYKVPCKCRWDISNHGGVADLKTTEDASNSAFARQAANFFYHMQGAHYLSGGEHVCNATPQFFAFVAVESNEPHGVACYHLGGDAVLAGTHLLNVALDRYAHALAEGRWPGYPETIEPLRFPKWAMRFDYDE